MNASLSAKVLVKGNIYHLSKLRLIGWTVGDGSGSDGYNKNDYFREMNIGDMHEYIGPDEHGIEPIFD